MDITKKVAALRFKYHANMLDVCNVLNQIGILKDEKSRIGDEKSYDAVL